MPTFKFMIITVANNIIFADRVLIDNKRGILAYDQSDIELQYIKSVTFVNPAALILAAGIQT